MPEESHPAEHHDEGSEPPSDDEEDDFEVSFTKCGSSTLDSAICGVYRLHYSTIQTFDLMEVIVSFFLFYLSWSCKLAMLYVFFAYWVENFEDPWEDSQYEPMKAAITKATLMQESLLYNATFASTEAVRMCTLNRAPVAMHFMILFLWVGDVFNMLGNCVYKAWVILALPDCTNDALGLHNPAAVKDVAIDPPPSERAVTVHISHLGLSSKMVICACILFPDFILTCCVGWTGAKYISLVSSVGILVKSSLKLNFIARVEKFVYPSFVSYNWNDFVTNSNYRVMRPKGMPNILSSWWSTLFRVCMGMATCRFFLYFVFPRVEEFRQICLRYYEAFPLENVRHPDWWYPEL